MVVCGDLVRIVLGTARTIIRTSRPIRLMGCQQLRWLIRSFFGATGLDVLAAARSFARFV